MCKSQHEEIRWIKKCVLMDLICICIPVYPDWYTNRSKDGDLGILLSFWDVYN